MKYSWSLLLLTILVLNASLSVSAGKSGKFFSKKEAFFPFYSRNHNFHQKNFRIFASNRNCKNDHNSISRIFQFSFFYNLGAKIVTFSIQSVFFFFNFMEETCFLTQEYSIFVYFFRERCSQTGT